jgi:hypothetical protein
MALVHELGHVLTFQKDVKEPWLSVSGWEERKKPGTEEEEFVHTTNKVPSQYALSSPSEDLAESVTAYRFAASKFAREFPERYEFLKTEFFKGIEFQRVEQCQPSWDRAVAEQVARVKKRDSLQAQRIERRAIINDALVGLSPVIRPVIDERVMDAAMKRCWNPVLAEATGRPTNADACLENFIVETVIVAHVRRSGVRVFAGDVPNEMLARFRVETARMASLRTNINQHAAELLLDSFNKSLFTWADDKESCEASARGGNIESSFFSAWRVTDERGALKSPELFRELYRDACERLVDYHDAAFLPRALNPFGFNPFQIMLETKGRKNVGSSTR